MSFYFAGGEMCSFIRSDSNSGESTTSLSFDSSFSRCSMIVGNSGGVSYIDTPDLGLPDEFYVHLEGLREIGGATPVGTLYELRDGSTALFRIRTTGTSLQMQRWNGSAWTNVGAAVLAEVTYATEIDLYIDGNTASGTATLFVEGTERESAAVDLTLVTGIETFRAYGLDSSYGHWLSQVIIADEPTIGMRLASCYPGGAGATTAWTGDYTAVDELSLNDGDFIYSDTNGQVELFTATSVASLTGYVVRAVGVYARAKRGAAGPANLQLAIRTGGTTYTSASKALGVGYAAYGNLWDTNPNTTNDWLASEIPGLQFGVKAIT